MNWQIFAAEIPTCPKHGGMKPNEFLGSDGDESIISVVDYICMGFDGEGCDYTVPIHFKLLGYVDEINFEP